MDAQATKYLMCIALSGVLVLIVIHEAHYFICTSKAILPLIFLAFAIYHVKFKSQYEMPLRDVGLDNGSSIGGSELFEKQ